MIELRMLSTYTKLSLEELVDQLAQNTARFTQLLSEKAFSEEYYRLKITIDKLATEIEQRKKKNTTGNRVNDDSRNN